MQFQTCAGLAGLRCGAESQAPKEVCWPGRYAVRRVAFSPHAENIVASCSYDLTVRLWDVAAPENAALRVWDHHSEFVVGLDFSTLDEGLLASTGWDELTFVWPSQGDPGAAPR